MLSLGFSKAKWMRGSSVEQVANVGFGLCARLLLTLAAGLVAFCALAGVAAAQNSEYYLDENGTPAFSSPAPTEYGYVEQANGHVHIEIPLGNTIPQRGGQKTQFSIAYDSNIWSPGSIWGMTGMWLPGTGGSFPIAVGGWKLLGVPGMTHNEIRIDGNNNCIAFNVTESNSTSHWFPTCSANSYATDSSGYYYFYPITFGGEQGSCPAFS